MTVTALITGANKGIGLETARLLGAKTALNMVTAMYAKELRDTKVKVNAANPGYCATDLNGNSGFRTAVQGAEVSVHLAALPADGSSGWSGDTCGRPTGPMSYGVLPW